MSEFWTFTLSGVIVAWVPIAVGFIVHHWRIKVYINRQAEQQTGDVRRLTDCQTQDIKTITNQQTEALTGSPRRRRRRRA